MGCPLTVSDAVATKHPLYSIDGNTTVGATLDVLEQRNFAAIGVHCLASAAPDVDPSMVNFTCRPPIAYLGILSITDILTFIKRGGAGRLHTPISKLIDISPEASAQVRVPVWDSLHTALKLFSTGEVYHAIARCPKEGKFWMLAQSDLVACFLDREAQLPKLVTAFNTSISEVSSVTTTFLCPDSSMNEAIESVLNHHGVPVINEHSGKVIETLAVSDLTGRARMAYALSSRTQTVGQYLLHCKGDQSVPPISLSPERTVRYAARTMIINGVHRVWIHPTEKGLLPQVISLTDILTLVWEVMNTPLAS